MNKEVIKKYWKEFEHWVNGKSILARRNGGNWFEVTHNTGVWEETEHIVFVINDEYVEYRKALAEGKTVEEEYHYEDTGEKGWQPLTYTDFRHKPLNCRIKPDKPKFKVGDKVSITSNSDTWQDVVIRVESGKYHFESGGHLDISRQDAQLKTVVPKFKVGDYVKIISQSHISTQKYPSWF